MSVLLLAGPRLGRFLRLAVRRFEKEVLRVGRWVHPDTGEAVTFSREDLDEIAANTTRWLSLGHGVSFPDGHAVSARGNLGRWVKFARRGDTLFGVVEIPDDEIAEKIGATITDVSAAIDDPARASNGEVLGPTIVHVAATPEPVIPGQDNFMRLSRGEGSRQMAEHVMTEEEKKRAEEETALSRVLLQQFTDEERAAISAKIKQLRDEGMPEDQAVAVAIKEVAPEKSRAKMSTHVEALECALAALGLPADADEGAALAAIRALFEQAAAGGEEEQMPAEGTPPAVAPVAMARLARENAELRGTVTALGKRVEGLEGSLRLGRDESAARELGDAMQYCARANHVIDKDEQDVIAKLFAGGDAKSARVLLARHRRESDVELARRRQGLSRQEPEPTAEEARRKEIDRNIAAMVASQGYPANGSRS